MITVAHILGTGRIGGTEVNTLRLIASLRNHGVSSVVMTVSDDGDYVEGECIRSGIPFLAIGRISPTKCIRIVEFLRKHRVQVIHAYGLRASAVGKAIRVVGRLPLLVGIRGNGCLEGTRAIVESFSSRAIYKYVCNSGAAMKALSACTTIPKDKIVSVPNGLGGDWSPAIYRGTDSLVVATVANFTPAKDYSLMLQSIAEVIHAGYHVEYKIAGDGPGREHVIRTIERLGLGRVVSIHGTVRDIDSFLNDADVFLFMSKAEGFPNSVLEAMFKGLPVIVSPTGGIPEMVEHERTGLIVNNLRETTAALIRILLEPDLRKTLGLNARERVSQDFSIDKQARRYADLYEAALNAY